MSRRRLDRSRSARHQHRPDRGAQPAGHRRGAARRRARRRRRGHHGARRLQPRAAARRPRHGAGGSGAARASLGNAIRMSAPPVPPAGRPARRRRRDRPRDPGAGRRGARRPRPGPRPGGALRPQEARVNHTQGCRDPGQCAGAERRRRRACCGAVLERASRPCRRPRSRSPTPASCRRRPCPARAELPEDHAS